MKPLVSILIPCFNGAPWIAQAIQSALDQTYLHKEVIVVDDGSTDNSLEVIKSFGGQIRFESGPNRGGNAARNRLLQLSTGSWLSYLDADDYYLPTKVEKQVAFFSAKPDVDVVYGPTMWIGDNPKQKQIDAAEDEDLFANYFRWKFFSTITILLKKSAVAEVGGWKEDQRVCQEHELVLRLMLAGKKFAHFPEPLSVARLACENSVSRRSPINTIKQRMDLSDKLESHLRSRGEMNDVRTLALGQARFEAARSAFSWDKPYARDTMQRARECVPSANFKLINPYYRVALRLVGFDLAEQIASSRRQFFAPRTIDSEEKDVLVHERAPATNLRPVNKGMGQSSCPPPLVSILIPCFNAGPWIAQCIQSALDQTYPHKEVVVVDDGSTDNSLEVIRSFGDRVRFETGPNRGGNAARNRLMQLSNGEWLEFLDADDFLLPEKIEKQIALIETQPALDVVYSPTLQFYSESGKEFITPIEDDDLYANYFRWACFSTTSLLLKKSAIVDVGGWREDQTVCQEHELTLRLILANKKFAMMPEPLGVNRMQYANSVSRRSPLKTLKTKMELSEKFEAHLLARGEMNEVRQFALAQAHFEAARSAYRFDKEYAKTMMKKGQELAPISRFKGVNPVYRWAVRLLGFELAERIAEVRRGLFAKPAVIASH